jgi:ADP-ribose pyrophosphatase YjhB (NUDIX family)
MSCCIKPKVTTSGAFPGGRVEPEEHAAQTVIREMEKEVGASVHIEKTLCIVENFFGYNGRPNHEIGFYLVARLEPGSPLLDLTVSHHGSEETKRLTFTWVPRRGLSEIDVGPVFLPSAASSRLRRPCTRDPA